MKYKEVLSLSEEEKVAKIQELKKELMKFGTQAAKGSSPENAGNIHQLRKDIAKLLKSRRGEPRK
jgi:ribosomal protein L29